MLTTWGPSGFGKLVTGSGSWELILDDDGLTVHDHGTSFRVGMEALASPIVLPGLLWSSLVVPYEGRSIVLHGIPYRPARELGRAVELQLSVAKVKAWAAGSPPQPGPLPAAGDGSAGTFGCGGKKRNPEYGSGTFCATRSLPTTLPLSTTPPRKQSDYGLSTSENTLRN
jgi:hypothetical protein